MDLNGVVTTSIHNVIMTQKEYEAWLAIERLIRRSGRHRQILIRVSEGHILVYDVNEQPERVK